MNPPVSRRVGFLLPVRGARKPAKVPSRFKASPDHGARSEGTDHEICICGLASGAGLGTGCKRGGRAGECGDAEARSGAAVKMTQVTTFDLPWRIAFLPDSRMLITEKVGALWLVTPQGGKI